MLDGTDVLFLAFLYVKTNMIHGWKIGDLPSSLACWLRLWLRKIFLGGLRLRLRYFILTVFDSDTDSENFAIFTSDTDTDSVGVRCHRRALVSSYAIHYLLRTFSSLLESEGLITLHLYVELKSESIVRINRSEPKSLDFWSVVQRAGKSSNKNVRRLFWKNDTSLSFSDKQQYRGWVRNYSTKRFSSFARFSVKFIFKSKKTIESLTLPYISFIYT